MKDIYGEASLYRRYVAPTDRSRCLRRGGRPRKYRQHTIGLST
jgi:hypothetical protein